MAPRPCLAFACAHLTDERLYAAQLAALGDAHECRVFVLREHDSLAGLSLGGYLALEVVRRQLHRLERLVLLDTTAAADAPARKAGRLADIAKVQQGGIEALIPELPARWLLPAHAGRAELVDVMAEMARSVGARGQLEQQQAMLARVPIHTTIWRPWRCRPCSSAARRTASRRWLITRRWQRGSRVRGSRSLPSAGASRPSSTRKR